MLRSAFVIASTVESSQQPLLVVLDETAAATSMARRYGRAPRGERCRLAVSPEHYTTTTVTAALCSNGLCAARFVR